MCRSSACRRAGEERLALWQHAGAAHVTTRAGLTRPHHPAQRPPPVSARAYGPRACLCSLGCVVVVAAWCLVGVDVGWGDEPGDACFHIDAPLFLVDEVVVVAAEQGPVVCSGGAAV